MYGVCGECNEPGTGWNWCQPCNAKRFKENFKNWTSGNKCIDELIQHAQLNATDLGNCLEWIPFENFKMLLILPKVVLVQFIQLIGLKEMFNFGILNIKSGIEVLIKKLH